MQCNYQTNQIQAHIKEEFVLNYVFVSTVFSSGWIFPAGSSGYLWENNSSLASFLCRNSLRVFSVSCCEGHVTFYLLVKCSFYFYRLSPSSSCQPSHVGMSRFGSLVDLAPPAGCSDNSQEFFFNLFRFMLRFPLKDHTVSGPFQDNCCFFFFCSFLFKRRSMCSLRRCW